MQATQYDIAKATGLSQATISRALRGDPSVLAETRDRILAVCADLNYRPSMGARLLAEGQKAMVGISLSANALPTDRYVTILHQNLLRALQDTGWGITLLAKDEFQARLPRMGAMILIGVDEHDARLPLCRANGLPFVAIGYVDDPAVFCVVPDDDAGPRMVVRHFHAQGRRAFGIMSSFDDGHGPAMGRRAAAAQNEAGRLGLHVTLIDARHDVTSTLSGYRTTMRNREAMAGLDCLFCDTDEHALGTIAALTDQGRVVPRDIMVAGFDDLPGLARDLTTVRQDFAEIARAAITLIEEARDGGPARTVMVPVDLIVRKS